jgi:hypothetical protein
MALNSLAINSVMAQGLSWLEHNQISDFVIKEVSGANIPKTIVTRTLDERIDVATGQFGGTIGFLGGGLAMQYLGRAILDKLSPGVFKLPKTDPKRLWAVLGASYAIFAVQGALYWAVPFFRNYLTAKRSGSENFLQVIGAESPEDQRKRQKSQKLKARMKYFRDMPLKILAGGGLTALGALALAAIKIKNNSAFGPTAKLFNRIALEDGLIKNYGKWATFWFVAVASYVGWIHAVRDKFELKEQLLQFGTFVASFFGPQPLIEGIFKRLTQKRLPDHATALLSTADGKKTSKLTFDAIERVFQAPNAKKVVAQNLYIAQSLLGWGFSIVMLGTLPQLLNWTLTNRRLEKASQTKRLQDLQTNFNHFLTQVQQKQTWQLLALMATT